METDPKAVYDQSSSPVRNVQIVAAGLIGGVLSFGTFAVLADMGEPAGDEIIAYVAAGFAAISIVLAAIVPPSIVAGQRKQISSATGEPASSKALVGLYQTKVIVGLAILEGASFFCLIAYLASQQWWLLPIVALLLAAMVASFPSRSRFDHWGYEQRQLMGWDRR